MRWRDPGGLASDSGVSIGKKKKNERDNDSSGKHTYQTRWRPLGMDRTALTAPLPVGNLSALSGSQPLFAFLTSNSSTVPFLLPA